MKERRSVEALPDEMLMKILEIGIENSILLCSDICRISVCSKHLNKLSNDDSLWSIFLTLEFPDHDNDVNSCSKKSLYKYRLWRWLQRRIDSVERKLYQYHYRTLHLDKRIERIEDQLMGIENPIEKMSGELLDMLKERNFLRLDLLVETSKVKVEEATTKRATFEAWMEGLSLATQASLANQAPALASVTPISAPSLSAPLSLNSFNDLGADILKKINSSISLHEDNISNLHKYRQRNATLRYRIQKRHAQLAVLEYHSALLSTCSDLIVADDDTEGDNDTDYDTEEDDDTDSVTSEDDVFADDTEDDGDDVHGGEVHNDDEAMENDGDEDEDIEDDPVAPMDDDDGIQ